MTTKPNVYQRLNAVMQEVKYIQKGDKSVNGQYRFVTHDSVSAALHEPMAKHGIVMAPSVTEIVQEGNRTLVKMEVAFINMDSPEDRLVVNYVGYGIDSQDKGIGKAISYAVKYALLKVFVLETGDDPERDNIDFKPDPVPDAAVTGDTLRENVNKLKASQNKDDAKIVTDFMVDLTKKFQEKYKDDWMTKLNVEVLARIKNVEKFKLELAKWVEERNKATAEKEGLPF